MPPESLCADIRRCACFHGEGMWTAAQQLDRALTAEPAIHRYDAGWSSNDLLADRETPD